jgi:hypothetical protein
MTESSALKFLLPGTRASSTSSTSPEPTFVSPFENDADTPEDASPSSAPLISEPPTALNSVYRALQTRSGRVIHESLHPFSMSDMVPSDVFRIALREIRIKKFNRPAAAIANTDLSIQIHSHLQRKGVADLHDWTDLLQLAARTKNANLLAETWNRMLQSGFTPGLWAWQAHAYGYARVGNPIAAASVIERAKDAGFDLDHYARLIMVEAWGRAGDPESALKVVRLAATEKKLTPKLLDALITAYGRAHLPDQVLNLMANSTATFPSIPSGKWPRQRTYRLAFFALSASSSSAAPPSAFLTLRSIMKKRGAKMDLACYECYFMRLTRERSTFRDAAILFMEMREKTQQPASEVMYQRIEHYFRRPQLQSFRAHCMSDWEAHLGKVCPSYTR